MTSKTEAIKLTFWPAGHDRISAYKLKKQPSWGSEIKPILINKTNIRELVLKKIKMLSHNFHCN